MGFTLHGVADALRGERDPGARMLLLSMLEQGVCDLATANAPDDPAAFTSLVENLRGETLDAAERRLPAGRYAGIPPACRLEGGVAAGSKPALRDSNAIADDIAGLRFTGRRPAGLPGGFGRRKFWISIPEALAVHQDTLESVVAATRRAVNSMCGLPALVIGIRSSGSLLAPLVSALCARNGAAQPYATLRPLLDRQSATDDGNVVSADPHTRQLIESCRGPIWVVDDPSDSGRTRDAAIAFVERLAPQCTVLFVPVGRQSAALRDYDHRIQKLGSMTRLAPHEAHEEHHRAAWLSREHGRVYKAYGDPRIAALECRALRAFAPALDYEAAGEFISARYLREPHRTVPARAQIAALGESMARYHDLFRVEPVAPEVWSDVLRRRGADGGASDAVQHLVRGNGQLAWWHYRWTGPASVERVSADLGHWSTVVDIGEMLASALVELELDPAAFRQLVSVYISASGDRNVWERMDGCLRLYLRTVSDRARRAHPSPVEERHAAVRHGMAWLEDAGR